MITSYEEFLEIVEDYGVMAFYGKSIENFPKVQDMTEVDKWYREDPKADPSEWKDRAIREKKMAFGWLLGGDKGLIVRELYPYFYAACHQDDSLEERLAAGKIKPELAEVYALFDGKSEWTAADIRAALNTSDKKEAAKIDKALIALQKEFLISISDNRKKVDEDGKETGWHSHYYCKTETSLPEWIDADLSKDEAREFILAHCEKWSLNIDLDKLRKKLFGNK